MKKIGIIILIIILLMLTSSLIKLLLYAINNNNLNWFDSMFANSEAIREEKYIQKEQVIELNSIDEIEIELKASDVNINFTDDNKIKVVQYAYKTVKKHELFEVKEATSKITIKEQIKPHFYLFYSNHIVYDVYIPKQYEKSLKISSASGDINVNENLKFKDLIISSTSGDIKISNIEAKNIEIQNVSGDIKLGKLNDDNLKLKTTSGDIKVDYAVGNIDMKSTSGDILVNYAIGKVLSKTTSGEIEFTNFEGSAELQSVSGNIESENFKITENSKIKTTSGEVNIELDVESNCEIQYNTVSGNVKLPNNKNIIEGEAVSKLNVETVSGNIWLGK